MYADLFIYFMGAKVYAAVNKNSTLNEFKWMELILYYMISKDDKMMYII